MREWIAAGSRLFNVVTVIGLPFLLAGSLLAGNEGLLVGAVVALIILGTAWILARPVLLLICNATPVEGAEYRDLSETVNRLATSVGVRTPMVAISALPIPNALAAVTPGGGLICVTEGLMAMLSPIELEAVLAHEVAHLAQPGRASATLATVFAAVPGALTLVAGVDLYFERPYRRSKIRQRRRQLIHPVREAVAGASAPLAAILVRLSTSERGELGADERAVRMTDDPVALATALRKLQSLAGRIAYPVNPAIAHLLVIHPFGRHRLGQLFNTHPPTLERLAALNDRVA